MNISNTKKRFYIYAIALLPLIVLLASGLIMLKYHTGAPYESTVMGLNGDFWLSFHKVMCVITLPLIGLHLFVKTDWVKNFFTLKLKDRFKKSNVTIFIVFLLCTITGVGSWFFYKPMGGIHNKFGLLLIILFGIHLWNYRKQIIKQFKNTLKAK